MGTRAQARPEVLCSSDQLKRAGLLRAVAIALGHQDGGNLVRRLYGHRDKGPALDRIVNAYATRAEKRPKRLQSSTAAPSQQGLFGDTYV